MPLYAICLHTELILFSMPHEVLAVAMKGVIVGEVDARIALRISLSYLTQQFIVARRWGVIGRGAL